MTEAESPTDLFEETTDQMHKATESYLDMQREMVGKWATMLPAMTASSDWLAVKQTLKKDWAATASELMHKHREQIDHLYQAGIESLEEALRVTEAESPDDFRERYDSLCRSSLNRMKSTCETQLQQIQEAVEKWIDLYQINP